METLNSERLSFRPYEWEDLARSVALFTDPAVMRFVGQGVMSEEEASRAFDRLFTYVYATEAFDVWAVFERKTGAYVGHAEIKPRRDDRAHRGEYEIIYVLARSHWGRGLATEIAEKLVEYGLRELKLARVSATVDPDNHASIHVLEKLKMCRVDEFTDETGRTLVYAVKASVEDAAGF